VANMAIQSIGPVHRRVTRVDRREKGWQRGSFREAAPREEAVVPAAEARRAVARAPGDAGVPDRVGALVACAGAAPCASAAGESEAARWDAARREQFLHG
jgi:hypothetical protein